MQTTIVRGYKRTRRGKITIVRSYTRQQRRKKLQRLSGKELLLYLENALINSSELTPEQRQKVLQAQEERRKEHVKFHRREELREERGERTRYGAGSWQYPTRKSLKAAGIVE